MMAFSQAAFFARPDAARGAQGAQQATRADHAEVLRRLDALAQLMDNAFVIPGLNRRVGLDAIIGLVPGVGDAITTLIQSYVIFEARRIGAPKRVIARMVANVALDGLVGLVPFAGDAFDAVFKANLRNVRILREYLAKADPDVVRRASTGRFDPGGNVIDAEYRVVRGER